MSMLGARKSIFACWSLLDVHGVRAGRESLFELDPQPREEIKSYINLVSDQWDQTLARLKSFVERPVRRE
jgi:hypothetical protein